MYKLTATCHTEIRCQLFYFIAQVEDLLYFYFFYYTLYLIIICTSFKTDKTVRYRVMIFCYSLD